LATDAGASSRPRPVDAGPGGPEPDAGARGPVFLFWAQVVGNAGLFVALLLVTRALGPSGRGTVAFISVTALVTAWVARLGVTEATVVFAAQRPAARPVLLSNIFAFATAAGSAGALLVSSALLLVPDARPPGLGKGGVAVLALGIVASALADSGYRFLLGCSRFRAHALTTVATSWLYPLVVAVVWALAGLTALTAALIWVATQGLRALSLFSVAARESGFGRPSRTLLDESMRFGVRAWVGTLADSLNFRIDQILIALIASEAALGLYAVAVSVSEVLQYLPGAIATALLPLVAGSDPQQRVERTLRAFRSTTLATLASSAAAALVVPPLLPVVFGAAFEDSVVPFLVLLLGAIGFSAMNVFANALVASSRPALSSLAPFVSLVVGLALDLLLIPRYEATGAAAAASASFLAGGATALVSYRVTVPFPLRELVHPRRGDLDVLRALVHPLTRVVPARRGIP
jgi:O-antigen/teichoic acid export membrane protein